MSDELRERLVARIKETRPDACVASSLEGWSHDVFDLYIADAAIALIWNEAMEEAAKVADTLEDALSVEWRKGLKCDSHQEGRSDGAGEVAAAIRARKKP